MTRDCNCSNFTIPEYTNYKGNHPAILLGLWNSKSVAQRVNGNGKWKDNETAEAT